MAIRALEWIMRSIVMSGLETIRQTPALIDEMFVDLSQSSRDQLRTWLLKNEISFLLAFPRGTTDPPFWTMTMVGEQPAHRPIGGDLQPFYDSSNQLNEERGEYVRKTYQIHTITSNADTTLALSTILQHILKSNVPALANLGFVEIETSQQDALDFKTDYLQNFVFARVTYMTVLCEDSYVSIDTQAKYVQIGQAGQMDADGYIDVVFPS